MYGSWSRFLFQETPLQVHLDSRQSRPVPVKGPAGRDGEEKFAHERQQRERGEDRMILKTHLIFTFYTIYGILFKGESGVYVRMCWRCVCLQGRSWAWWCGRTHGLTRGPGWQKDPSLSLSHTHTFTNTCVRLHAIVYVQRIYARTWYTTRDGRERERWCLSCNTGVLSRMLTRNEGNPIFTSVCSASSQPRHGTQWCSCCVGDPVSYTWAWYINVEISPLTINHAFAFDLQHLDESQRCW